MTRQVLSYNTPAMMNTVMVIVLWSIFPDAYLDRGFPLKSAISKALQNLMLSGISGMSAREKKKVGEMRISATDTEHKRCGSHSVKLIILSFLQWQTDGQEWTRKSKRKSRNRVEGYNLNRSFKPSNNKDENITSSKLRGTIFFFKWNIYSIAKIMECYHSNTDIFFSNCLLRYAYQT